MKYTKLKVIACNTRKETLKYLKDFGMIWNCKYFSKWKSTYTIEISYIFNSD